jgi:outer membrane protein TolC
MKLKLVVYLSLASQVIYAQGVLYDYIKHGLENNLALQQKEANYRHSLEILKEAKGLFYPAVSFNARYTKSEGGRVIYFPAGDLLNPVYTTLNHLTGSSLFPQVENQEIKFLRPEEHETKIRVVMPVFNTDLYYNARIKKELSVSEEISVIQYRRELTAEIKKAYYSAGMAESIMSMLQETRFLLLENVRVNSKLVENNKITIDNLYRSQTELSRLDQQKQDAFKNKQVSRAWFNFLLNRPLTDSIILEAPAELPLPDGTAGEFARKAVANREEIKNLEQYCHVTDITISMNQSAKLPDLFVVTDYGFQGEKYEFTRDQDYLQASVVLSWNIYAGFQNRSKIKQAMINREIVARQLEETKNRIELQVINSMNGLKASEAAKRAAGDQVRTAREGFRLVKRKYDEGQASLLEFMDARNALTQAEENLIITKYNYLSDYADFEKVTAIIDL